MEFYPVLPADASPLAGADACCAPPGIVAVRPRDLRRPGQGGVSALVTAPPGGRGFASGEELVFCHQVTVAPAVVRRGGQVQAGGWLPGHVTLGILEACLPDGEIEELAGDFGCAEERQRLLSSASTVRVIGEFPAVGGDLAVAGEVVPQHQPVIKDPEVVARQQQPRGLPAGQPPDVLACRDVHERDVMLEPDVLADRLADDPGSPDAHATPAGLSDQAEPRPPSGATVGGVIAVPGLPPDEQRVGAAVAVPRLQVHRRPFAGAQQLIRSRTAHQPASVKKC
jgi:hypothetical protein